MGSRMVVFHILDALTLYTRHCTLTLYTRHCTLTLTISFTLDTVHLHFTRTLTLDIVHLHYALHTSADFLNWLRKSIHLFDLFTSLNAKPPLLTQ